MNVLTVLGERYNEASWGVYFFENARKNLLSSPVPEVVFILESKVSINRHYYNSAFSPWSQRSGLTPEGLIPIFFGE